MKTNSKQNKNSDLQSRLVAFCLTQSNTTYLILPNTYLINNKYVNLKQGCTNYGLQANLALGTFKIGMQMWINLK